MNIKIDKQSKTAIYVQLAGQLKKQILSGELAVGSTLPSERAMARLLSVHRNTVVKAYTELKAEELVESKQGIGYIVTVPEVDDRGSNKPRAATGRHSDAAALTEPPQRTKKPNRVHWKSVINDRYLDMQVTFDDLFQRFGEKDKISMGSGIACPGIYDTKEIAENIAAMISREGKTQYFYSPYKGDKALRYKLVSFLSTKGIKATTGEIQILSETNQALDFVVMLLVKPGDTVIMEEPVSPDAYRTMELAGAHISTIPVDSDGMDCDALERTIIKKRPVLIFVNSSFHDPTGVILPLERRKKIVELSNTYRIPIVEEDAASELVYEGMKLPPLKAFDKAENVIYIYSFSLTFVPGLSLAFVVANRDLIESLSYMVSVRMMAVDWITQKLLAKYLSDGSYFGILNEFRENYAGKQKIVCAALDEMKQYGISYDKPRGGVYIWCRLPSGVDSKQFIDEAYKRGLSLLPGYVFYPLKNGGREHIRINYSFESEDRLVRGLEIFKETLRAATSGTLAHKK